MVSAANTWANNNAHTDTTINSNGLFVNSARVILYARPSEDDAKPFIPLGVVQGWSFSEQRQVEEVFELGSDIRYIIPGRTTGQLAITRLMVSGADLLNCLYGKPAVQAAAGDSADTNSATRWFMSLKDINVSLDLVFVSYHNDSGAAEHLYRQFSNCWIVARQESITANQVIIAENCTLVFEKTSGKMLAHTA